jgi:hypothetical protein
MHYLTQATRAQKNAAEHNGTASYSFQIVCPGAFSGFKMQEPRGNMSPRMGKWKFFAREKWLFPTLSVFACLFSDQDSIDKKTS